MPIQTLSKDELKNLYLKLYYKENKHLTIKQWNMHSETPSITPVEKHFGTWNNFIRECGLIPNKKPVPINAIAAAAKWRVGKRSTNWKGGRRKRTDGYIALWKPDHINSNVDGYIHEHRFIMSEYLTRPLTDTETVHHINGKRDDNRLENLELWTSFHPYGQRHEDVIKECKEFLERNGYKISKL